MHFFDKVQLYARKLVEWGTSGYKRDTTSIGAETPQLFRSDQWTVVERRLDSRPSYGFVQGMAGIRFDDQVETFRDPTGRQLSKHIRMFSFTFGGRW